ncbi:MAG: DUF5666 domain-containing protein [Patescibacteria group bacterium]
MKKTVLIAVVVAVIVGVVAFAGGTFYGRSKSSVGGVRGQQFAQRAGQDGAAMNRRNGANFTSGQIISQDDKSITVKGNAGGSKIIFLSSSTEFSKFASGTVSDLIVGKSVTVTGQTNSDGSLTAQTIQIRPLGGPGGIPGDPNGNQSGQPAQPGSAPSGR